MAHRVLTLDLAKRAGWAFGPRPAGPLYGEMELYRGTVGGNIGRLLTNCRRWLLDLIAMMGPTVIVFEAPISMQGRSAQTELALFGLAAIVMQVACERGIQCRSFHVSSARKQVLGRANFGGRDEAKHQVMQYCRNRGWEPQGDNAADALILLVYVDGDR